jgi:polysaccharide pyruvyl transferase WcaK-like protein
MPLALLAGSFGRRDPGEEAVLETLIRALPGWDFVVASRSPSETAAAHGCRAVPDGSRVAVGRALAQADATVLAGGIIDELGTNGDSDATGVFTRVCALLSATQALGKPAALIGIGSAPLDGRRRRTLARAMVRQADLLVLREAASARILAAAGAAKPFRVGADPAWSLFEFGAAPAIEDAGTEGRGDGDTVVAVLDHDSCDERLVDGLASALDAASAAGARVRLQPWRASDEGSDDVRLAAVVASRLSGPVEVMEPPVDLAGVVRTLAGRGLVIAPRHHALIAAAVAGTPAVAVAREPGLVDLARRLGYPAVAASAPPERLANAIRLGLADTATSRSAIQGQVSSAEEGFRLLRLLLSRGASEDANDLTGLRLEPAATA